MSLQKTAEVFDPQNREPANIDQVWTWGDGVYQVWDSNAPLSPERGYWVHCRTAGQTASVKGIRADGIVRLQPEWNLVSPAADWLVDAVPGIAIPIWHWAPQARAYRPVGPGAVVTTGLAYWFYVSADTPVLLDLAQ